MSHLDDEGGDRAGVGGAGVGDLDVLEAGVVDHLAPLVPVDVGRGTRAVTNQRSVLRSGDYEASPVHDLALELHGAPLADVEVLVTHDPGSGL